ncbi:CaiB/BaiF CoA transferase family protein [Thalassovita taeanensis]|uniref:Crotonobetainyl-CoA:carnitine CoA-transferase CaiB n=1 Tax=Thalassovita taeanensis TaxID=657014 RepID=A0A1H9H8Q6_9RHOB|nr:CaiB/BaiF CoA-transferase family protein [Thalassovita taeanensis]SEQ58705.1 Crotonobetainyl-CoA:carnitine CoA-transferase CaiB [Thalassovita taeanensis]
MTQAPPIGPRPLDDILVVSIEQAIAAPYCARMLADQGARVIKVERPDGGDFARHYDTRVNGLSSHFVWCNRSKESLALDLKNPEAVAVVKKLIARADVFIQNLAPGAANRLGLDEAELRANNPRLVTCSISGFGEDGPYGDRKAYDLLIQAEAGFLSVTGTPDTLTKSGISVADIAAGVTAYHSILAALLNRARTGVGDHIEVSMLEAMAEWMGYPMYFGYDGAPPPPRAGAGHASIFPYGPFPTQDGTVLFGIQNDREWASFCHEVLENPEMADDPRFRGNEGRATHREAITAAINAALTQMTSKSAMERLNRAAIATAEVRTIKELWAHPQLSARDRWQNVETSAGEVPALTPITGKGWSPVMEAVPGLGDQTEDIFTELGLSAETRARLAPSKET